jgi:hypothetical protein
MSKKIIGRPPLYSDDDVAFLCPTGKTRVQPNSDRRAIVNRLVDAGGKMTLGELDKAFGFDIRPKVLAMMRSGWVRIEGRQS